MKRIFSKHFVLLIQVVCILAVLAAIIVPNFLKSSTRALMDNTYKDMRMLARAVEKFHADNGYYPAFVNQDLNIKYSKGARALITIPTFQIFSSDPDSNPTLTTPVSYLKEYPEDRFARYEYSNPIFPTSDSTTYAYCLDKTDGNNWIIWSPGPDMDYDMLEPEFGHFDGIVLKLDQLKSITYDPTNGVVSSGDLFLTRGELLR